MILAFDVKVERDAQELADSLGVRIFCADIIYHLFDQFMAYRAEIKRKKQEEFKFIAVFPCKVRILPQFIFNTRDPIVVGVVIEAGFIKVGTPLCVPSKEVRIFLGQLISLANLLCKVYSLKSCIDTGNCVKCFLYLMKHPVVWCPAALQTISSTGQLSS